MNVIKDLVPDLDLCKQIPPGVFENSALVWSYSCDKRKTEPFVEERDCIDFCRRDMINAPPVYPAPTLAEIMRACDDLDEGDLPTCCFTGVKWMMESRSNPFLASIKRHRTSAKNPATAALKLWLELNKEGDGK